jgi:hypothetical protein
MAGKQVLEDVIQAAVFFMGEFRIFVKGEVAGAANFPRRTNYVDSLTLQGLKLFTHSPRSGGCEFYGPWPEGQRYFRTALWITCRGAPENGAEILSLRFDGVFLDILVGCPRNHQVDLASHTFVILSLSDEDRRGTSA